MPLAIDGIKHVVLIGDDKQLPSLVTRLIVKEAMRHWFRQALTRCAI
ncbi:hypothetical protein ACP4OV_024496 [Aristida adscensionis]